MYGYGGLHVSSYYFSVINHRVFFNDKERERAHRDSIKSASVQKTQPTVTFGNLSAVYQSTGSLEDIQVRYVQYILSPLIVLVRKDDTMIYDMHITDCKLKL